MKRSFCLGTRIALYGLAVLALGCAQQQPAPDTRAADEAAIRDADAAWSRAATAKDLEGSVSFCADDASISPPNQTIVTGQQAIRQFFVQMFETPGFSVSWQPVNVGAAGSGDLGYSQGTYEMTMNDPRNNPVTDRGKYITIWKKQPDGSWKVAADIFNSDLQAAGQPAR